MADHLDIDPHGRIVPQDDAARRALADRAGRFRLLPSAPDLLVACRTPAAGGAVPPARLLMAGDLAGIGVGDVIALVQQSRLSGVLTVASGGAERAIVFQAGEVRGARSGESGERLVEVAVRLGYLHPEELARAGLPRTAAGRALLERGLIAPADLWKCLREQVVVVFDAVLLAREGVFSLVHEPEPDVEGQLALSTQALLMDGIRRIDELALFKARIPGPGAYLLRREPRVAVTLKPVERDLLQLVDGRRSVAEIAQAAHLGEFDAIKLLYHLAVQGHVEAVAEPAAAVGASPEERLATVAAGMNAILQLIAREVAAAGGREPFAAAVRGFLGDPVDRHAPLWRGLTPGRDGTLDDAALRERAAALAPDEVFRVEPSGDRARYLLEALRELMFFHLFLAGQRLPRPADDRLHAEVKRRLGALGEAW